MIFHRYLVLSECDSFLDIIFVWYELNNAFSVFHFEDFQNLAYGRLAASWTRVGFIGWRIASAMHSCEVELLTLLSFLLNLMRILVGWDYPFWFMSKVYLYVRSSWPSCWRIIYMHTSWFNPLVMYTISMLISFPFPHTQTWEFHVGRMRSMPYVVSI